MQQHPLPNSLIIISTCTGPDSCAGLDRGGRAALAPLHPQGPTGPDPQGPTGLGQQLRAPAPSWGSEETELSPPPGPRLTQGVGWWPRTLFRGASRRGTARTGLARLVPPLPAVPKERPSPRQLHSPELAGRNPKSSLTRGSSGHMGNRSPATLVPPTPVGSILQTPESSPGPSRLPGAAARRCSCQSNIFLSCRAALADSERL